MATVSRLTCPDCKKVMRPAKPLQAGKKVKCPECGNIFVAGEAEEEAPGLRRPKGPSARKSTDGDGSKKKARKPAADAVKAAAKSKPKPRAEAPRPSADDEEGGTYSFVDDGPKEGEEEERPEINYAPDMSIKDLRGPATELLVRPSNFLLMDGVIGFVGYVLLMIIMLIPAVTPLDEAYGKKKDVGKIGPGLGHATSFELAKPPDKKQQGGGGMAGGAGGMPGGGGGMPGGGGGMPGGGGGMPGMNSDVEDSSPMNYLLKEKRSILEIFGIDFAALARYPMYMFFLCLFPVLIGMVYCGFLAYGAVQTQSLTSRTWGLVSSIMAMVPYAIIGLFICIGLFFQFFLFMILDEEETVNLILGILGGIIALLSIGAGVYAMITLNKEEVIDGFEYEPD